MEDHMEKLRSALEAIESRHVTSGNVNKKVSIKLGNDTVEFPNPDREDVILQTLEKHASTAPFGQGTETIVNKDVRNALQIHPEQMNIDFEPSPAMLEQIRCALVPESPTIHAKLHKLCIYEEGGHFKKHRDTPRDETNFGTLVVCLPTKFTGGNFVLNHNREKTTFNWATKYSWDPNRLVRWAAFFGDVEHTVEKVLSGARIALTYCLYRSEAIPSNLNKQLHRAQTFRTALGQALRSPTFFPSGGAIGYHCQHLYEEKDLSKVETQLKKPNELQVSKLQLKNVDALVSVIAASVGIEVELVRLLTNEYTKDAVLSKIPKSNRSFGFKALVEDEFVAMCTNDESVRNFGNGDLEDMFERLEWIGKNGASKEFAERFYGEYFGNEACCTTFYISLKLILNIPPYNERNATDFELDESRISIKVLDNLENIPPSAEGNRKKVTQNIPTPTAVRVPVQITPPPTNGSRTITIQDLRGMKIESDPNRVRQFVLAPHEGLRELKMAIRKACGRVPAAAIGSLFPEVDGQIGPKPVTGKDLCDGLRLSATYRECAGNPNHFEPRGYYVVARSWDMGDDDSYY